MTKLWKGFLMGIGLASILSVGLAFAVDEDGKTVLGSKNLINEVNKLVKANCVTYVSTGRISPSGMCMRNEVMTGIRSNYVYCSEIQVDCFSKMNSNVAESNQ
jgi:hypothetical protein